MTLHETLQASATALVTGVVGWHLPTPKDCWRALAVVRALSKGPILMINPIALVSAALTLGEDAVKLYQDISHHDKAGAVAAVLDTLPAVSAVTGKPLADLQGVINADTLGAAYDLEQDLTRVLPLIEAALAKKAA